jgi:branched-subunit amino acid ABC-type transport system permease component
MFESLVILAVVAIGGASVCSGALAGGLAIGSPLRTAPAPAPVEERPGRLTGTRAA